MDPSMFLEVTLDGEPPDSVMPLDILTEDDIVLLDNDYDDLIEPEETKTPLKRRLQVPNKETPPLKKAKKAPLPSLASKTVVNSKIVQGTKFKGVTLSPKTAGIRPLAKQKPGTPKGNGGSPSPGRLKQSITWKYRQLAENQYTADIRKSDLLKNYEPEKCSCTRFEPKEEGGESACGSGCINRSTYSECDPDVCVNGKTCTNMAVQRRQYAPGLERFMTAKKGWGVRARQSIAKGSFILEYTGEICTSKEFERRMLDRYKVDNHHYCLAMDNRTMIDAHRAGSECRFVNHSCEPNCEMEKWNVGGLSRMALFSLRDILPTEEICYDYNFSLFNTDQGQDCMCGAKTCRGVIGGKGKDYLITLDGEESAPAKGSPKVSKASLPPDPNSRLGQDGKWFAANLSPEELKWVETNAPVTGQLEAKTIKCSVCNEGLNFRDLGQCQRHPDLGVLMCSKCKKNYGKGGWDKDPDGNDEFCRWCSEGGQIYLCDFCPHAFCNKCLRWNLGRKYLKKIEEEEKWKCVLCDPSFLREARALYWAIYKYHKDKPARGSKGGNSSTPVNSPARGDGAVANGGKAKTPQRQIVNGRTPGVKKPSSTIEPSVGSANKKPQKNGATSLGAVKGGPRTHINGMKSRKPLPDLVEVLPTGVTNRHYVDLMIKDTDDCIAQFVSMLTQVRKRWRTSKKKDADVTASTKKLREILNMAKHNIVDVDKKVVNSYRSNLEDADVRDIAIEDVKDVKENCREKEIFSKSKDIGESPIETVESTPDFPFLDSDLLSASIKNGYKSDESRGDTMEVSRVHENMDLKNEVHDHNASQEKYEVFSDVDKFTPSSDSIKDEVLEEMDKSNSAESLAVINADVISTVKETSEESEVPTETNNIDNVENLPPSGTTIMLECNPTITEKTSAVDEAEIIESKNETEDVIMETVDNSEVAPLVKERSAEAPTQNVNYPEDLMVVDVARPFVGLDENLSEEPGTVTGAETNLEALSQDLNYLEVGVARPLIGLDENQSEKPGTATEAETNAEALSQDLNHPDVQIELGVARPLIDLDKKQSEEPFISSDIVEGLHKDSECKETEEGFSMAVDNSAAPFVSPVPKMELESKMGKQFESVQVCNYEEENIIKTQIETEDDVTKTVDTCEVATLIKESSTESPSQDLNCPEVLIEADVSLASSGLDEQQSEQPGTVNDIEDGLLKDSEIQETQREIAMVEDKSNAPSMSLAEKVTPDESKKRKLFSSVHVCDSEVENIVNKPVNDTEEIVDNIVAAPFIRDTSVEEPSQDLNFSAVQSEVEVTRSLMDLDDKLTEDPVTATVKVNGLQHDIETQEKSKNSFVYPALKVEPEDFKKRKLLASVHVCDSEVENIVNKNSVKFKRFSKSFEEKEKDKSSDKLVDEDAVFPPKENLGAVKVSRPCLVGDFAHQATASKSVGNLTVEGGNEEST